MALADTVAADDFFRFAEHLERLTDDGLIRVDRRQRIVGLVATETAERRSWYQGPDADSFDSALAAARSDAAKAEPTTGDAYRALRSLAAEARRVGGIVREADQYEKSWNQQVVANWSEWQDRTTTAVADALGFGVDGASVELTARYQELTRQTEAASERRRVALQQWRDACTVARTKLSVATDTLAPLLQAADPALVQPERSYNKDAARDHVRKAWYESIEQKLEAGVAQSELEAWWRGLSDDERKLLMANRTDLIMRHIWPILTSAERQQFRRTDRHPVGEFEDVLELEVNVPAGPVYARLLVRASAKAMINSDGTVDLTIDFAAEGAVGGGWDYLSLDGGSTDRLVLTKTFKNGTSTRAVARDIEEAMKADVAQADRGMSRTREVLARHFDFTAERAQGKVGQALASIATSGGPNASIKERLVVGTYARSDGSQSGAYVQGSVEGVLDVKHAQATAVATFDGKLYLDDQGRRFVELAYKGDVSASANPTSGYKQFVEQLMDRHPALRDLDLPDSALASMSITTKTEVTDANAGRINDLLVDLSLRRLDPAKAQPLLDESEVVLVTSSGQQVIVRPPANPFIGGQASSRDAKVDSTYRKPPGGDFYPQGTR